MSLDGQNWETFFYCLASQSQFLKVLSNVIAKILNELKLNI